MEVFRAFFPLLGACAGAPADSEDIDVADDALEVVDEGDVRLDATDDGGLRVFLTVSPGRGVPESDSKDSVLAVTLLSDG